MDDKINIQIKTKYNISSFGTNLMKLLTAIECPGLSTGLPSLKRPMRGPRKIAATRAQVPPKKCTTPLPAMSMKPISFNQPSSAHAHRDTTGYTKPAVFIK